MVGFVSGITTGKKLGNGHFGEVFEGHDPAHGKVAVKILSREWYHDDAAWPKFKAAYLDEAKNLAKATHKNVVQVFHVVEATDGDSVAICMRLCSGGSLQERFKAGPMTLADVRKAGTEVLMGLGAMHSRGMIHRDIKPANILLGEKGQALLSDFGLVTDDLVLGYASQAGYTDHIAYEVWHGKGTSVKSDIWALGLTLYRLLHGQTWYNESPRPADIVKDGRYATKLSWLPHVPKSWRRVIRKMLKDDDASRYQNAGQALKGLSVLPVSPEWKVTVEPELVTWQRKQGARRIMVEWHRHSARKHEWKAWSEPVGTGRRKRLGGSVGMLGRARTVRELENFFQI